MYGFQKKLKTILPVELSLTLRIKTSLKIRTALANTLTTFKEASFSFAELRIVF